MTDTRHTAAATLAGVGRALAHVGAWVGRTTASAYHGVDPDLRTHLAQLPLVGLTLLARGRPATTVPSLPDDGHRPVLFVHGLGGGPGNFLPMCTYFRFMGRTRTFALALPSGSLTEMGSSLATLIEAFAVANDLPPDGRFDVVAHSMGGLVSRLALTDPRVRARVETLVTLGTPHSGSHLARYGAMDYSRALRPNSAVIAELAQQLPWPGPPDYPRLVALWSDADVILLPASSAQVAGAENIEMSGFTHYSYLLSPTAWRVVFDLL